MAYRPGLHFLNSPFGDTTYTKVFVGGLAWETHDENLRRHFAQYGEILEAVVITDKNTGRSKGYGFVTLRDPVDAAKACADPNPIIDGRRANCNLASLGRPRPLPDFGHPRAGYPNFGSFQGLQGAYIGNPMYQPPVSYNNQQGFTFPPYGYPPYGSNYVYPQGIYNTYAGQQYLQMYGLPGAVGSSIYPYGQLRQPIPGNVIPSHQMVQFSRPSVNEETATPIPAMEAPYHHTVVGAPLPTQTQISVPAHSHTQTEGSGSEQARS